MQKYIKRLVSFFLSLIIAVLAVVVPVTNIKADSIFSASVDMVKLIHNTFLTCRDVAGASWDACFKIANDTVDFFQNLTESGVDVASEYGVNVDQSTGQVYFKQNSDNTVTINKNFIKVVQEKAKEQCYALDGYYLIEPASQYPTSPTELPCNGVRPSNYSDSNTDIKNVLGLYDHFIWSKMVNYFYFWKSDNTYLFCSGSDNVDALILSDSSYISSGYPLFEYDQLWLGDYSCSKSYLSQEIMKGFRENNGSYSNKLYGAPFKLFYSKQDAINYFNQGRQYYVPNLPVDSSGNLTVPIGYFDNDLNLPDIGVSLDSLVGKAEADVQANIDLALKNYIDKLLELNRPTPTTAPTPTKAPTSTPAPVRPVTPTPVLPNVTVTPTPPPEDFSSINKWLEQIYNWLLDFGDKHETFTEKICDYIDSTDGKLDHIIEAIDKLSQGDTEGEINGCKYDYTVLSEFMTKLWNESDKKFDKMVELLEENNEYQQKIVDSLNQIKALLVADTVLDVFKNRSNETANKAKEKFPTSLPWDIALVVNAFSATPKEPVIELPIKIESMNIDEKIVVDLSSEEWVKLAKTCRYLLSILFVLYMVHLSRKFFSKGDD